MVILSNPRCRGFTLMESVISVGLLALVIPLVVALVAASGTASRSATDDTKAAFMARSVMEEIVAAREGGGDLIEEELEWPEFPGPGGRYVITADDEGNLLSLLEAGAYETGVDERGVAYLISVRGEQQDFPVHPELQSLSKVEIMVEFPAIAPRDNRRSRTFIQLLDPNED